VVTEASRRTPPRAHEQSFAAAFPHFNAHTELFNMSKTEEQPDILVSVYGKNPPRAAEFGKGASTVSEIEQATAARREAKREPPVCCISFKLGNAGPSRGVTLSVAALR
jgi:hypothetical protein